MEPGFLWMLRIAAAFSVAAIIAQWIRLLRKPATCLRCGGRLKKVDGTWVCEMCVYDYLSLRPTWFDCYSSLAGA
jgi:hypothetical protein